MCFLCMEVCPASVLTVEAFQSLFLRGFCHTKKHRMASWQCRCSVPSAPFGLPLQQHIMDHTCNGDTVQRLWLKGAPVACNLYTSGEGLLVSPPGCSCWL
jgi:hypothetical protein